MNSKLTDREYAFGTILGPQRGPHSFQYKFIWLDARFSFD